jgi:hypothetical protein
MLMLFSVAAGLIIMALALTAMIRNMTSGGLLGNPARFLASGALLVAHFPLVDWVAGLVQGELDRSAKIDPGLLSAHWSAVIMVCAAQLIILPTAREVYAGFLYRRFGALPGVPHE